MSKTVPLGEPQPMAMRLAALSSLERVCVFIDYQNVS